MENVTPTDLPVANHLDPDDEILIVQEGRIKRFSARAHNQNFNTLWKIIEDAAQTASDDQEFRKMVCDGMGTLPRGMG